MVERLPLISDVHFEQTPNRLKIVLPLRRNWPFLIIYTILAVMWLVMMIGGVWFTIQIGLSGERYVFVFVLMLLTFLFILFRFRKHLFRQWAIYLAGREILFINTEELIIRRPVSIWGNTDVYGMEHIQSIQESDEPQALFFKYGYRSIYFGEALSDNARTGLGGFLNTVYFPDQNEIELS
ncbi:MAG: hypothetical protein R6X18_11520 [Chloroflexota bacterium]|jgi:hypothetical protein